MMQNSKLKGYVEAIISSATFGTIPLFSIPVLAAGMQISSLLVYRFGFACLLMMIILLYNGKSLRLTFGEGLRLSFMALLYAVSAICLVNGYNYLPSGVATTLLFSYPVFTAILEIIFSHHRLTLPIALSIMLAVAGVAMLSGIITNGFNVKSSVGLLLELSSGLLYAIYMVAYPNMKIKNMGSLTTTFFVFLMAMLLLALYSLFTTGYIQPIGNINVFFYLLLLGFIPTTISNVTLVMAMKNIDSTSVATLGAFEPLTAMAIGILVFGEPMTWCVGIGFVMIVSAVYILIKHNA